jgi:hypothetical protein
METFTPLIKDQVLKETSYKLVKAYDVFELRKYTASTMLEIIESGNREIALSNALNKSTSYLNKNNFNRASSNQEALPYVVMQDLDKGKKWKFEFYLQNDRYQLQELKKDLPEIKINQPNEKYYATIKASGMLSNEKLIQRTLLLKSWIAKEKLIITEAPKIAKYKSFWDYTFFEKREIMIEVKR